MKKLICILFLFACGSSSQGGETTLTLAAAGFNLPIRVAQLESGKSIVAEAVTAQIVLADFDTGERKVLASFDANGDFSITINGLLLDRNFAANGFLYVYHGDIQSNKNLLTRLELREEVVISREVISTLTDAGGHNGGGMYQFENGNILLGTGDHVNPGSAQDPNSLAGKLLLLSRDGKILNPNYASGLRNPFGISGEDTSLFVIDNGPECDDEINLIREGANYGWGDEYVCGEDTTALFRWPESLGTTDIIYRDNKLYTSRFNSDFVTVFSFENNQLSIANLIPNTVSSMPLIDAALDIDGSILFTSQDGNIYRLN